MPLLRKEKGEVTMTQKMLDPRRRIVLEADFQENHVRWKAALRAKEWQIKCAIAA